MFSVVGEVERRDPQSQVRKSARTQLGCEAVVTDAA